VRITGPFCKEDIPMWEKFREQKRECDAEIAALEQDIRNPRNKKYRAILIEQLSHERKIREMLCTVLPDETT